VAADTSGSPGRGLDGLPVREEGESVPAAWIHKELNVKRLHLLLVLAAAVVASIVGVTGGRADPMSKVLLCHGTASATNSWVVIDVSGNALPAQTADNPAREITFQFYPDQFTSCADEFNTLYNLNL
jgi:hypothetical protein